MFDIGVNLLCVTKIFCWDKQTNGQTNGKGVYNIAYAPKLSV